MPPLIEKKPKQDTRTKKQSYAFYLSRGLVDDLAKVAKATGKEDLMVGMPKVI